MYETKLARTICDEARKKGKIKRIVIEIDAISDIDAELLETEIERLYKCEADIRELQPNSRCRCGYTGIPVVDKDKYGTIYKCPECKKQIETTDRSMFRIARIEIE